MLGEHRGKSRAKIVSFDLLEVRRLLHNTRANDSRKANADRLQGLAVPRRLDQIADAARNLFRGH